MIVYLAIIGALAMTYLASRPQLRIRRHRRKLRAMTPDELADEARHCAQNAGYERLFADGALFRQQRNWSQASLARAIDELYAKAAARDLQNGGADQPGSLDDFYDFGLCDVREALEERPRA